MQHISDEDGDLDVVITHLNRNQLLGNKTVAIKEVQLYHPPRAPFYTTKYQRKA
jgi:hypothetical protein